MNLVVSFSRTPPSQNTAGIKTHNTARTLQALPRIWCEPLAFVGLPAGSSICALLHRFPLLLVKEKESGVFLVQIRMAVVVADGGFEHLGETVLLTKPMRAQHLLTIGGQVEKIADRDQHQD